MGVRRIVQSLVLAITWAISTHFLIKFKREFEQNKKLNFVLLTLATHLGQNSKIEF